MKRIGVELAIILSSVLIGLGIAIPLVFALGKAGRKKVERLEASTGEGS